MYVCLHFDFRFDDCWPPGGCDSVTTMYKMYRGRPSQALEACALTMISGGPHFGFSAQQPAEPALLSGPVTVTFYIDLVSVLQADGNCL